MAIQLSAYGSAVFLAMEQFRDDEFVDLHKKYKFEKVVVNGLKAKKIVLNPDYPYKTKEEEKVALQKHTKKRINFVIGYLKENYPDTDYAEKYMKDNGVEE